jgi:hypothetical protein
MTEGHAKEGHATGPTFGALILFIVAVLLVVAGTGYDFWQGQRQAQDISAELRALCAEQGDVGQAPLSPKSSELGVKLITDFRNAYAGLGCTPPLPPPPALLLRLAAGYGIKVRH